VTSEGRDPVTLEEAHVIVVEDQINNSASVLKLLRYSGVLPENCDWRNSGWGVLQLAESRNQEVDLILLDIRLPQENGYEVLKRIRADARLGNTRVVAVTAFSSVEEMREAQRAGFDGFLAKPLTRERFPDQLRRILSNEPVWEFV
jgi:CheY-like chemotaxis protein